MFVYLTSKLLPICVIASLRLKCYFYMFLFQIQNGDANTQFQADYKGEDFSSSLALANLDIINSSGSY